MKYLGRSIRYMLFFLTLGMGMQSAHAECQTEWGNFDPANPGGFTAQDLPDGAVIARTGMADRHTLHQ